MLYTAVSRAPTKKCGLEKKKKCVISWNLAYKFHEIILEIATTSSFLCCYWFKPSGEGYFPSSYHNVHISLFPFFQNVHQINEGVQKMVVEHFLSGRVVVKMERLCRVKLSPNECEKKGACLGVIENRFVCLEENQRKKRKKFRRKTNHIPIGSISRSKYGFSEGTTKPEIIPYKLIVLFSTCVNYSKVVVVFWGNMEWLQKNVLCWN